MTDTSILTRVRSRISVPQATAAMKGFALTYFTANNAANAEKKAADTARKSLFQQMQEAKVTSFAHTVTTDKGPVTLDVSIDTPTGSEIDAAALYKAMNCAKDPKALKQFLEIVSCTKKSVVDALGTAMATRVETPTTGTTNVNVKLRKAS